jgi:enterochelin esterase-like enzyme
VIGVNPLDWSLVDGWLPVVFTLVGFGAVTSILARRDWTWWLRVVPITLTATTVATATLIYLVDAVWRPWPDPMPPTVMVWVGIALFALAVAVIRLWSLRWRGRVAAVLAGLLVVVVAAEQANAYFSAYPTLRAALGRSVPATPFDNVAEPVSTLVSAPPGGRLADVWHPPAGMPARGTVSEVIIPSSRGFGARPAWVYLPPAYHARPRAQLPVLVLVAGQPGGTRDWIDAGQLPALMDRFAASHDGLAPIVVLPDDLGSTLANPMCLDSKLGNVETYLSVDVPNWIKARLQVAGDSRLWAIGGFSQGGTCALQLAVRAPSVYPNFVDISGQREPSLGTRKQTVDSAFGGDPEAFRRVNPMDLLARNHFPGSAGMIVAGEHDKRYNPDAHAVFEACRGAGMDVRWAELPGGHTWAVWRPGLAHALPWLAYRLGLVRS